AAMRLAGHPAELHRKLALLEDCTRLCRTAQRGHDAGHSKTDSGDGQYRQAAVAKSQIHFGSFPQAPIGVTARLSINAGDSATATSRKVNAVYRIVQRSFVAMPHGPLIFTELWHNY